MVQKGHGVLLRPLDAVEQKIHRWGRRTACHSDGGRPGDPRRCGHGVDAEFRCAGPCAPARCERVARARRFLGRQLQLQDAHGRGDERRYPGATDGSPADELLRHGRQTGTVVVPLGQQAPHPDPLWRGYRQRVGVAPRGGQDVLLRPRRGRSLPLGAEQRQGFFGAHGERGQRAALRTTLDAGDDHAQSCVLLLGRGHDGGELFRPQRSHAVRPSDHGRPPDHVPQQHRAHRQELRRRRGSAARRGDAAQVHRGGRHHVLQRFRGHALEIQGRHKQIRPWHRFDAGGVLPLRRQGAEIVLGGAGRCPRALREFSEDFSTDQGRRQQAPGA
mmetsp:Transcript_76079/g.219707  ORF Transcript_76079/g.219707 Transcript_76079/m.219707 type:complete len:331 (-) Transcript_76079:3070-4062(-)